MKRGLHGYKLSSGVYYMEFCLSSMGGMPSYSNHADVMSIAKVPARGEGNLLIMTRSYHECG